MPDWTVALDTRLARICEPRSSSSPNSREPPEVWVRKGPQFGQAVPEVRLPLVRSTKLSR
jgi:hypothetical protein